MIETIFEAVRHGDVILWIGSGFSRYAGYAPGAKLTQIIYNALTPAERAQIDPNLSLIGLSEQFVRLKRNSRNMLVSILQQEFMKRPTSATYHKKLSQIPHFETIITTNYDRLFEDAYGIRIHPIITQQDIPYVNGRKELFKVHGDIQNPDSIVITETDYRRLYYNNFESNLIWSSVKARIANKTLVFIGYDFEDDNIKMIIERITEALGPNRKQIFLIAPGLRQHKISYLENFRIQYLDSKGETFLEKLIRNIKDNITTDFGKHWINAEIYREFCQSHGIAINLRSSGPHFNVQSIEAITKQFQEKISLSIKDTEKARSVYELFSGNKTGNITLENDVIGAFKVWLNDVNIIDENAQYQIILGSKPIKEGIVNLVFEDGAEFEDITYQLFRSKDMLTINCSFKNGRFKLTVKLDYLEKSTDSVTADFTFERPETFRTVNDAIRCLQLAIKAAEGKQCLAYFDGSLKAQPLPSRSTEFSTVPLQSALEFYEDLKKIEHSYQLRFLNFGNFTKEDTDNAYAASMYAGGAINNIDWTGELKFEINESMPLELLEVIEAGNTLRAESQQNEQISILGQSVDLGYQVIEGTDLYILNKEEIKNGTTRTARVKSKSGKVKVHFDPELGKLSSATGSRTPK